MLKLKKKIVLLQYVYHKKFALRLLGILPGLHTLFKTQNLETQNIKPYLNVDFYQNNVLKKKKKKKCSKTFCLEFQQLIPIEYIFIFLFEKSKKKKINSKQIKNPQSIECLRRFLKIKMI